MTKLDFFDSLKDIVTKIATNKEYLETIVDDVTDLLDDYESESGEDIEDEDDY